MSETATPEHASGEQTRASRPAPARPSKSVRQAWRAGDAWVVRGSRIALLLALLGLWELLASTLVRPFWISKPSLFFPRLWHLAQIGELGPDVKVTMIELGLGLAIGTLSGVVVGLVLSTSRLATAVFRPYIVLAYSFPLLAITPLFVVWFGLYEKPKIILVALISFFVMFFNIAEGLKQVHTDLIDILRVMGARRHHIFRMVTWHSTLLYVSTGLKSAVPFGLRAAVFGEILSSTHGIGHLIEQASEVNDSTGIMAGLALLVGVGLVLNVIVNLQERYATRWLRARSQS